MRPIGGHHKDQSFGSQIDKLIESLKSAGHSHTAPSRNPRPTTEPAQYFPATPDPVILTTSHGGFTTTSSQTSKPKSPPPPPSFYYPLFQFHNKYADRPSTRRPPQQSTKRPPTPRPAIVTWRPEKGNGLPEKPKGNQFVGGVTSLVSNIAVYEEDKYRPQPDANYITGENVIPEMAGGNLPDYTNIDYIDYIEGPNVISEMTQKTTTKRPAITFFPPSTVYPTQPPRKERPPTYKPQHHFPTTRPSFPSFTTNKPHFPNPANRPPALGPPPVYEFPQFETNRPHFPTTKPTYRPTFTLIPFNTKPVPSRPQFTTTRPTLATTRPTRPTPRPPTVVTEPTSGPGITTPQSYTPQFNPLFTETRPTSKLPSTSTSNRLPFSYPSSPFSYKPTYRPGFHLPATLPSHFNTNLPTRSTPKSPYKPTFKPAILATFAPSISISSLLPFSNTSTTARPNRPYPFATYPFPILPDFDPITNKPAEFIDSIQVASTATPTYFPPTSSSSTTATTQTTVTTTTSTTTTPVPDVVTIPGLPGIAIPSTPSAWVEYITAGINELTGLFRDSLLFTQSSEGQEASKDVGALTAVLGLPLVTGGLSMLGAGPAAVIAVAWLLPVASLLLLPGLAG